MAERVRRKYAPAMLMVASGFAGLGYQIVWTQQCALWLGHESAAVLAVVAAFFGGLSLGALTLGSCIERSARPARWYAACELTIAVWSLLLAAAMPPFSAWLVRFTGAAPTPLWQWSVAFGGTFCVLLPATAAMGATLPAIERITLRSDARSLAVLYAANTFGAVLGVLAAAFWLVPRLGLAHTTTLCVVLNLLCSVTALLAFPEAVAVPPSTSRDAERARSAQIRLAFSGLLGIGYEVLVVRVLSQVSEDTVYTFALLLAVYLVATAAGAAGYARFLGTRRKQDALSDQLLAALSAACLVGTLTLWGAEPLKAFFQPIFGERVSAAMLTEALPACFAFGPAALVMGALFSHLSRRANAAGISFGRALGVNTLGAALAPALFGVLVLPALGPKLALIAISVGYLALVSRGTWLRPFVWLPAAAALALAVIAPPLAFIDVPEGGHVVSYQDGAMAAVSVVEDADGVARLRIDNREQEGSSVTQRVDGRQAWLPLLLHPSPKHALFLGLGTGVTAASAAEDPTLRVDAVELLPEVVQASALFANSVADGAAYPRLHVQAADARRYIRASTQSYDVIVSDNFHPARSGSGSLYTVEHFQAVRQRLTAEGVFCQWLPLHQLDLDTLRSITRSFLVAYPRGFALLASNSLETPVIGLLGRRDGNRFDAAALSDRLARVALPERVTRIGLEDEFAVLGSFIAGPSALLHFAGNAVANTDDRPVVAYRAPRVTYAPDSSPRDRLSALLRELSIEPSELLQATPDLEWPRRLAAYWAARDRFIESGRDVRPSQRVEDLLAQVEKPLLSTLRISPDFRPAYDPLLSMAAALARSDPAAARVLLGNLVQAQPARGEAQSALASLNASAPTSGSSEPSGRP